METTRALVFDLDDTLYPERAYACSGFAAVAAAFTGRLNPAYDLAARMRELFDTGDRHRVFNVIARECGLADTDPVVRDMITVYRRHRPAIHLFADADAALSRLRPSCRLGLITDGCAVTQHAKIDALDLRRRFDHIIVTDDWGREFWKPHPRAFEEMSARLAVPPDRCTYIADNPAKDFVAPNAMGWHTVLIERPDRVHAAEPTAQGGAPSKTIGSLEMI